jgi:hypothetical protein
VHFASVKSILKNIIKEERIVLPRKFFPNFLHLISKVCNYEEEGKKIRPNLVLGFKIKEAVTQVPNHSFIPLKVGKRDGSDLEKILKAIIPFCNNGWIVYIDIKDDLIEYGLLRAFNGPKGLSLTEVLFINSGQNGEVDYGLIGISVISNYEMCISGLRSNAMTIDFRLILNSNNQAGNCEYNKMAEDITSDIIDLEDRKSLVKVFEKLMKLSSQRVHGTICLVVKKDFTIPEFIKDGIWLTQPINLAESALNTQTGIESEKYYGVSGLIMEMMNVDGITVIDSQGKIRGFNVFINQAKVVEIKVGGGARKRAAYSLLNTRDTNILGVYFQSQDGNAFYERMSEFEQ